MNSQSSQWIWVWHIAEGFQSCIIILWKYREEPCFSSLQKDTPLTSNIEAKFLLAWNITIQFYATILRCILSCVKNIDFFYLTNWRFDFLCPCLCTLFSRFTTDNNQRWMYLIDILIFVWTVMYAPMVGCIYRRAQK